MTNDLKRRIFEHKNKLNPGFTAKYNLDQLMYFESFDGSDEAANREQQIKRYKKECKRNLKDSLNPEWKDLSISFLE